MPRLFARDVVAGALLCAIGAAFLRAGDRLAVGTARAMGPGTMPRIVAWTVVAMGAVLILRACIAGSPGIERGRARPFLAVLAAVVAFALVLESAGLIVATIAVVVISRLAAAAPDWIEVGGLAAGLAALGWLIFIRLLGLPIPAFPQ